MGSLVQVCNKGAKDSRQGMSIKVTYSRGCVSELTRHPGFKAHVNILGNRGQLIGICTSNKRHDPGHGQKQSMLCRLYLDLAF